MRQAQGENRRFCRIFGRMRNKCLQKVTRKRSTVCNKDVHLHDNNQEYENIINY
jgi:hypothetical protein